MPIGNKFYTAEAELQNVMNDDIHTGTTLQAALSIEHTAGVGLGRLLIVIVFLFVF